ncbi:MAG TPA: patatin-like phospholipase family protein [Vicinamibacterales bacterium]|nr:patatin-like phospholipase family protein [Vicinamibacterales bacterium]
MTEPRDSYSPERRTALLFTGTGADGAYHAGALRALQEAGVKIDLVGGRGIGALGAVLAAVDGGSQLWEGSGFWRSEHVANLYRWRWPFTVLRWLMFALLIVLAIPAAVILLGLVVYPIALLLGMAGLEAGATFVDGFVYWIGQAFVPAALPTWIPRLAALFSTLALVVLGVGAWLTWWRSPLYRRSTGSRMWALLGSPIDASGAVSQATDAVWRLLKGGAAIKTPEADDLSKRYAELLSENLSQPGFRELLLVVHDLDANRDLVFGLVRDPFRKMLFPSPGSVAAQRRAEAQDLASGTQGFLADVLAAALSMPGVTDSRLVRFAPDSYWRGETHRLTDRASSLGRLLEEAAAAGAEQVMIVAAAPEAPGPHELRPPRLDGFGRIGEVVASAEAAALADAVRHLHHRFQGVYVIRPAHNPIQPLDLTGAYDEKSDRIQPLEELMERGYEDTYRQFIEPFLGASGDRITQVRSTD